MGPLEEGEAGRQNVMLLCGGGGRGAGLGARVWDSGPDCPCSALYFCLLHKKMRKHK